MAERRSSRALWGPIPVGVGRRVGVIIGVNRVRALMGDVDGFGDNR